MRRVRRFRHRPLLAQNQVVRLQELMQFVAAQFNTTLWEWLLEQQIQLPGAQARNLAPKREHQVQHQQGVATYPLGVVLAVIKSLSAHTKQSTQVTDAHPGDFVFLEFQDCLVPDFFRMGSWSSCSATSIMV